MYGKKESKTIVTKILKNFKKILKNLKEFNFILNKISC